MRILLVSDLHLDSPFAWAKPEVGRKRRQALRDALAQNLCRCGSHVRVLAAVQRAAAEG